jgi:hypothetical protein
MKPEAVLELLETAAEQLKVRVSYEPLQTSVVHGGLCRVKGEYRIIIDKRASAEERVTTLATALAKVMKVLQPSGANAANDPASDPPVVLSPKVREMLRMHDSGPTRVAGTTTGGRTAA